MPKLPPTERLCQVLLLLLAGNGPAKIAQKMQRSDHTVKKHLRALYKLYEVEDGFGLMSVFIESSVLARLHARALELHKKQRDGSKPNCELHLEVRAHRLPDRTKFQNLGLENLAATGVNPFSANQQPEST